MPFPDRLRNWWMRATGNGDASQAQCQWRYFDTNEELLQCTYQGEQVHHPIAESYLLNALAQNPNEIEGLVVCLYHHIIGRGDVFEPNGSFHPDMGEARRNYHNDHDSFRKAGHAHHEAALRGERFWNGTPETDQFYITVAREIAENYAFTHPEDPKPPIKIHPKLMEHKKWYQVIFEEKE